MIDRSSISEHMEVLTSDGVLVGKVEGVGSEAIKLTQLGTSTGGHQFIPLTWVGRVDRHVHLSKSRAEVGDPEGAAPAAAAPVSAPSATVIRAGAATAAGGLGAAAGPAGAAARSSDAPAEGPLPPVRNPAVEGARPRGNYYLPWVLGALLLLLLLFALLRGCDNEDVRSDPAAPPGTNAPAAGARDTEGQAYAPGTIAYDLNSYLASGEPAPRTFTFDKLNFDTGSAGIRQQDVGDIDQLAQILNAHPRVRIAIIGYADARGSGRRNARLGQERANAVAEALTVRGIARDRLEARSGGESTPVARNDEAQGQAENRRTELIVVAR